MPRVSPSKPKKLSHKLLTIRKNLNLSQTELIDALGMANEINQSQISAFERGSRIPSLLTLLAYARLYGTSTDVLIDDKSKLP